MLDKSFNQLCQNNIILNNQQFSYCQKSKQLTNILVNKNIQLSPQNKQYHLFINSNNVQSSTIQSIVSNDQNFAVFGFTQNINQIQESVINVTINYDIYEGALICLQCNISVLNSQLLFIANGQTISSIILQSLNQIILESTSIQYRFHSFQSSGIVHNITAGLSLFSMSNVKILGNDNNQDTSSYISNFVHQQTQVIVSQVYICSNVLSASVNNQSQLTLSSPIVRECQNICDVSSYYTYGICQTDLKYSQLIANFTFLCVTPFEFDGEQCVCGDGYMLNGSTCVDIVLTLTNIQKSLGDTQINDKVQAALVQLNLSIIDVNNTANTNVVSLANEIQQHNILTDQNIIGNTSQLQNSILSIIQQLDQNIASNRSVLVSALSITNSNVQSLVNTSKSLNQSIIDYSTSFMNIINLLNTSILNTNAAVSANFSSIDSQFNSTNILLSKQNATILQMHNTINDLQNQIIASSIDQENQDTEIPNFNIIELVCLQQSFVQQFDIQSVTHNIQLSNISNSFVFETVSVNNAFIDIADFSLQTGYKLYKSQSYFYNLKVQLGSQSTGSGSIISDSSVKLLVSVTIQSKASTSVSVTASNQLNLVQKTSVGSNIRELLININFDTVSSGNLTLIGSASGSLNINKYQVLGKYFTTQQLSLCVLIMLNAQTYISQVNFKPYFIQFGNQSSYLLSYVELSFVQFKQITLSVGIDQVSINLISKIVSSAVNNFQYGGFINNIYTSQVIILNVVSKQFLTHQTQFIANSGQMIGSTMQDSFVSISNLCQVGYDATVSGQQITASGLIGNIGGKLSFGDANINIIFSGSASFSNIGSVGIITSSCQNATFVNIDVVFTSSSKSAYDSTEGNISALVGQSNCKKLVVNSSTFSNVSIVAATNISVLVGSSVSSNVIVNEISFNNIALAAISSVNSNNIGTVFGSAYNSNLQSSQLTINGTNITSLLAYAINLGGVVGYQYFGNISVIQSKVTNLYINGSSQCLAIVSGFSAGIYNVTQNTFVNIEFYKSSIFSLSQTREAASGGIMGLFNYSDIIIQKCNIQDITTDAQSVLGEGISSGFISVAQKYNVVNISNIELTFSFIYCNSRYPKAGGIVGLGFYGFVDLKHSTVKNTVIQSSDDLYQNQITPYYLPPMWGLACGFLAQYYNSNINIHQIKLTDSNISVNCYNVSSSSGVTSQLKTTMLTISQILIKKSKIFAHSIKCESYAAGICSFQSSNTSYINSISVTESNISSIGYYSFVSAINSYIIEMNETILTVKVLMTNMYSPNNQIDYGYSIIGSIYGLTQYSNTNTTNCKVIASQLNALNNNAIYMGGLIGCYSQVNATLVDSSITDSNISGRAVIKDSVVGGVVGYYVNSNVTLFDTNVSNLILQSFTAVSVYCGSLIGAAQAKGNSQLTIQNSNTYSISVQYSGSPIFVNYLAFVSTKSVNDIQIQVTNSQSLGFSTINGVAVTNCVFKVVNDGISYNINDNGC
ncbi:Hypothetical_protein [Hexamita inflata]|uniref:Hypothetical_protein n=1 Tax=Hexamita inflata TaxID=28002 RepID=A0AA86N5A2_9EUKA|nr:Hypothetical protein HINF_LOCUS683 [Hexamita inflata]CAI9961949.1 Hypothetical protein HINF_LOCUS49594 [Hexamita inflata]CAI9961956.1 Hypothetical protein HINF_LOCUS49601 [Hexamita inflata]